MLCWPCAGTLPLEWGEAGALPALSLLALGFNELTGELPAEPDLPSLLILWVGLCMQLLLLAWLVGAWHGHASSAPVILPDALLPAATSCAL